MSLWGLVGSGLLGRASPQVGKRTDMYVNPMRVTLPTPKHEYLNETESLKRDTSLADPEIFLDVRR